jgi:CofD-related protein of GAK system
MLSVGDLRNRLLALADESLHGNPEIYRLFSHRLAKDAPARELRGRLRDLVDGAGPLIAAVPHPMRQIIRTHLRVFAEQMPEGFDLRGASVGNLVLVGEYLHNGRDIDSVIFLFSKLVQVRGTVLPVVDADLHLAAGLSNGETLIGQHLLGGKEGTAIPAPVTSLRLIEGLEDPRPASPSVGEKTRRLIEEAELICYPMGSFFSSVLANLLPEGVGRAVCANACPKVYIPNMGHDPEQLGSTPESRIDLLMRAVRSDAGRDAAPSEILNLLIVDSANGDYKEPMDLEAVRDWGVDVIDTRLVSEGSRPLIDPELLAHVLLSLV